jgi:AcrR family transcriptional regulator
MRVIKDHDVRRKEIIDTAERLFSKKGYEETSVEEIIKKIGIAKGTFYYYFRSKEDLLDALMDRVVSEVDSRTDRVMEREGLYAVERMGSLFRVINEIGVGRERLFEFIHEDRNAHIHMKIEKRVYPILTPKLTRIIEQGVKEDVFDTRYPGIAALSIFGISEAISHGEYRYDGRLDYDMDLLIPLWDSMERILGARSGTFMDYYRRITEGGE